MKEARAEWRVWQGRYAALESAEPASGSAEDGTRGLQQVWLPDLDRVDRCTSCHLGIADPERKDAPQPFRAHPGRWLETHRPDRYGCTSCHGGQGEATTHRGAAHRPIPYWPEPMASRELMEARCGDLPPGAAAEGHGLAGAGPGAHGRPQLHGLPRGARARRGRGARAAPRRPAAQGLAGVAAGLAEEAEELPAEVADGGLPAVGARRRGPRRLPAAAAAASWLSTPWTGRRPTPRRAGRSSAARAASPATR